MTFVGANVYFHNVPLARKNALTAAIKAQRGQIAFIFSRNVTHVITTAEEKNNPESFKLKAVRQSNSELLTDDEAEVLIGEGEEQYEEEFVEVESDQKTLQLSTDSSNGYSNSNDNFVVSIVNSPNMNLQDSLKPTAPTVNLVLPESGPTIGDYKVALFGLNFIPSSKLLVKFGNALVRDIEYHAPTAIVVTLSVRGSFHPGEVHVVASNDGGRRFGPSQVFTFVDNDVRRIVANSTEHSNKLMQSQMQNLMRSVAQLQAGLANVQVLEEDLRKQLKIPALQYAPLLAPPATQPTQTTQPKRITDTRSSPKPSSIRKAPAPKKAAGGPRKVDAPASNETEREVRIFISSPFRDMNEERDIIVKKIIPRLRKLFIERDILLSFVDLRWGVTEAQNQQAATLLMCLREIDKCSIFIGLYGERYGWCMSASSYRSSNQQDELLRRTIETAAKEFPWIMDYKDRSVTEIEMRMMLDHQFSKNKKAWFYLRDPYFSESLPSALRAQFASEGPYEQEKLQSLKSDINKSEFPSRPYNRPTDLIENLYEDIEHHVNQFYPKGSDLSPLQSERFRHNAFTRSLTRTYLANEGYFMQLDKYASSNDNRCFLLVGESGIGKSALLANWSQRYKQHHPEHPIITHFVGCSSSSSNYLSMLRRVVEELQDLLGDHTLDVPSDKELSNELPRWLEDTLSRNKKQRLVILIDGLDSLDDRDNALDLLWLPQVLPSSVRIVISLAPGKVFDVLSRRNYENLKMAPLGLAERKSFIRMLLDLNSKKLNEDQEFKIASFNQSGNPRYLRTFLEDISTGGTHEELTARIDRNLKAKNTSQLYELLLTQLEQEHSTLAVEYFMKFLWASRRGLYLETELQVLLEAKRIESSQLLGLIVAVEELIFSSLGLLNFANKDIRAAVHAKYIAGKEQQTVEVHRALAGLFQKIEGHTERKVEELPYQLANAQEYEKLKVCLSDLGLFDKLYTPNNKFDLFKYWRIVESKLQVDVVTQLTHALDLNVFPHGIIVGDLFYGVASFFEEIGKYNGAQRIYLRARNYYETSAQSLDIAKTDCAIANIHQIQARYAEAEQKFKEALNNYTREKGPEDLDVSHVLRCLGSLYTDIGSFAEASDCFEKVLNIRIARLGQSHALVGETYRSMITFYEVQGKITQAIECGYKALKIMEEQYGPDNPHVSATLTRLGRSLMYQQKYREAKGMYKRALKICEDKLGADHSTTADVVYELGCFYFLKPEELASKDHAKNNTKGWSSDKAEAWFLRALKTKEESQGDHPDVAQILNRLGTLYVERTQFDSAEDFFLRSLKIRKEKLGENHSRCGQTYKHLITLYEIQEKYDEAINAGELALKVFSHLSGIESLQCANILVRLGQLYATRDGKRCAKAMEALEQALETKTKLCKDVAQIEEIQHIIQSLRIPAPPPPPKVVVPVVLNIEEYANDAPPVKDTQRSMLLTSIKNFGAQKELKRNAAAAQKKKANVAAQQGWWKQNYKYAKPSLQPSISGRGPPVKPQSKNLFEDDDDDVLSPPPPPIPNRPGRGAPLRPAQVAPKAKPSLFLDDEDDDDDLFGLRPIAKPL